MPAFILFHFLNIMIIKIKKRAFGMKVHIESLANFHQIQYDQGKKPSMLIVFLLHNVKGATPFHKFFL